MPTFGDVLKLFVSTLGRGAQHQYKQQTYGADYRQKEQEADLDMRKQVVSEAALMEKLTRERDMLKGLTGALTPDGGMPDAEALGAFEGRTALETADMARQKGRADIGLTQAQTRAADRGMDPAALEAIRQRGRMDLEGVRSEGREEVARLRAELTAGNRRPRLRQVQTPNGPMFVDIDDIEPGQPVAPRNLSAAERKDQAGGQVMREDIQTMRQLFDSPEVQAAVGPVAGLWTTVKRATVGVPDNVGAVARITQNLSDQLLRLRSGAQINEAEYSRLTRLVPQMNQPDDTFRQNMLLFEEELMRTMAARFGSQAGGPDDTPSDLPGGGWNQDAASAAAAPAQRRRIRVDANGNPVG